ncbi:hypothetical protein H9Q69_005364 [Fusarium xylarioides]|nr:hypothetical protein H9Q69_005364 [Fusarium xylarioides]
MADKPKEGADRGSSSSVHSYGSSSVISTGEAKEVPVYKPPQGQVADELKKSGDSAPRVRGKSDNDGKEDN